MAASNHDRVGKAMDLLRAGIAPFVAREVTERVKVQAVPRKPYPTTRSSRVGRRSPGSPAPNRSSTYGLTS